jgi:hypothetical protein
VILLGKYTSDAAFRGVRRYLTTTDAASLMYKKGPSYANAFLKARYYRIAEAILDFVQLYWLLRAQAMLKSSLNAGLG